MKEEITFKLSFIKRLKMSLFNFEQYHFIAADGAKRAIEYLSLLILIFTTVLTICINIKLENKIGEAVKFTEENIPNFTITDGKFHIESESPIVFEKDGYKLVIDNDADYTKYNDEISNYEGNFVLLTQNNIIISAWPGNTVPFSYTDFTNKLKKSDLNKDDVINIYNKKKTQIGIILFVYTWAEAFMIYFLSSMIDALALTILGMITTKIVGIPLKFRAMFSMTVSAMTLSLILNMIYLCIKTFTGFTIPQFQILYTFISYVYIVTALLFMRSNILKGNIDAQTKNTDATETD